MSRYNDMLAGQSASAFRARVVQIVALIPAGKVLSYGDVATLAGSARAARAVGSILKTAEEDLPWHRVVNTKLQISGGVIIGRPLLQLQRLQSEGLTMAKGAQIQDADARWPLGDAYDAVQAAIYDDND